MKGDYQMINRSEASRALAKAIAYKNSNKMDQFQTWVNELFKILHEDNHSFVNPYKPIGSTPTINEASSSSTRSLIKLGPSSLTTKKEIW
jgi:hypothetical protein